MEHLLTELRAYAQDRYYRASWDALLRWSDDHLRAVLAGAKTRRGAIAKAWKHIRAIDAQRSQLCMVQVYGPKPVRPVGLFEFLAAKGGLAPHPELSAVFPDVRPFIGGHGPLIRRNGMHLDDARRAAVEAGYLFDTHWKGGVATSTINDLLDALSMEARGQVVYANGEVGEDPASDYYAAEESFDDVPY